MSLVAVYEGDADLPFVRKLLDEAGLDLATAIDAGGKANLDADLGGYNDAAQGSPWFVLRDLDHDADCPPSFLEKLEWAPSRWMCFRLATREMEAWLLADHVAVGAYFRVAQKYIPSWPDDEPDPTRSLVALARRSASKDIRNGMVPGRGSGGSVGPLYEATVIEFGMRHWSAARASGRSPSLRRARRALRDLATRWERHCAGR